MNALWLTAYVLVWPVIVAAVLIFIARAFSASGGRPAARAGR